MRTLPGSIAFAFVVACGGHGHPADPDGPGSGSDAAPDTTMIVDDDGDGLDDAHELQLAIDYMPYISIDPADGCALDGMVVRVRPHPADATKILIVYDHLFQNDCGFAGHVGDDEVFGVAIDPALPAPAGILAIRAVSHQGTPCERDTQCSTCGGGDMRAACDRASDMTPIVYPSKDKHGQYATLAQCSAGTCFDQCTLNPMRAHPPVVNVGEPDHHLVDDLTDHGFITAANGWMAAELQHFDPWDPVKNFGGAGNIAKDLVDAAFEAGVCAH
jgi:hypothetical protein